MMKCVQEYSIRLYPGTHPFYLPPAPLTSACSANEGREADRLVPARERSRATETDQGKS